MNHRRLKRLFSLCCMVIFISGLVVKPAYAMPVSQSGAVVWYVSLSGSDADGLSWTTAFTDLQDALASAQDGDQIWVAEGVYVPGTERTDSFNLVPGVALYGGFAGTETTLEERDWEAHPTILSGDIDGNDVNTDGNFIAETTGDIQGGNSYHVVVADGTGTNITETTIFDGFSVSAGLANGADSFGNGGGFYCEGSGATNTCNPVLRYLLFSGNYANYGGGMYNDAKDLGRTLPLLRFVKFNGNFAVFDGGAIYNNGDTGVSNLRIRNAILKENHAGRNGGAIYNWAELYPGNSSPSVTNVIFEKNIAGNGGGAMYNNGNAGYSEPGLYNVVFNQNSANFGGAIINDGSNQGVSNPYYTNVSFYGNNANQGGAIYNIGYDGTSSSRLQNVILWGNHASTGSEIYNVHATMSLSTNLVAGGVNGDKVYNEGGVIYDILGNLDADPLFVDAEHGDFHLQANSPAIDAGGNEYTYITEDIEGNPRIYDGNFDRQAVVDLGAYETVIPCPTGSVLHVDQDSPNPYAGDSWDTAIHELWFALENATRCENVREVWVAEGVYTPGNGPGYSIELIPGVAVYGGFDGTENTLAERDWTVNQTILSGDIGGDDLNADGNFIAETTDDLIGDNSSHVVILDGSETPVTETTVLDGFIITAANNPFYDCGGGMRIEGQDDQANNPVLRNLLFSGNLAFIDAGGGRGGALCNWHSSPTIMDSVFRGNKSSSGGAVHNTGDDIPSNPIFENVKFLENTAGKGGAVLNDGFDGECSPTFLNTLFVQNSAYSGGAVYNGGEWNGFSNSNFVNVTFSNNVAHYYGGAIYNYEGENSVTSNSLTNVIFWGNTAVNGGNQVYNDAATIEIKNSIFEGGLAEAGGINDPSSVVDLGGNLSDDPLFVDPEHDNFHLSINSPAVDAGSNEEVGFSRDLDGGFRICDGNEDGISIVDMGAYEFQVTKKIYLPLISR